MAQANNQMIVALAQALKITGADKEPRARSASTTQPREKDGYVTSFGLNRIRIRTHYDKAEQRGERMRRRRLILGGLTGSVAQAALVHSKTSEAVQSEIKFNRLTIFDAIRDGHCKADAGTGNTNDRKNLQSLIDDIPAGGVLQVQRKLLIRGGPLILRRPISIVGTGMYTSGFVCDEADGVQFEEGVGQTNLSNFAIQNVVRHSVQANDRTAITIRGSDKKRPQGCVFENLLLDGFSTSIRSKWLWSSRLCNIVSINAAIGIHATGLSVNNFVGQCTLSGGGKGETKGIYLDGAKRAFEGWLITGVILFGVRKGVHGVGVAHCKVVNSIIDYCSEHGILIEDNGTNFGGAWEIHGNWIAMSGETALAGIENANRIMNDQFNSGNSIIGNRVRAYQKGGCQDAYVASAAQSGPDFVFGNTSWGMRRSVAYALGVDSVRLQQNTYTGSKPAQGAEVHPVPLTTVFESDGLWRKPSGARNVVFRLIGGGAGGGAGRNRDPDGPPEGGIGGESGELVERTYSAEHVPETLKVTVGRGGQGARGNIAPASSGTSSSVSFNEWELYADGGQTECQDNLRTVSKVRWANGRGGNGGGVSDGIQAADGRPGEAGGQGMRGKAKGGGDGGPAENGADSPESAFHRGGGGGGGCGNLDLHLNPRFRNGGAGGKYGGGGGGSGATPSSENTARGGNGADGIVIIDVVY